MLRVFFLLAGVLLTTLTAVGAAAAETRTISFDAFLDENTPIGVHHYTITKTDGGYKVRSRCRFDVSILFFNAYSYNHHAEEMWQDGCIRSLESKTIENGETTYVKGTTEDGVFTWHVNGEKAGSTTDCVRTFAYWHPTYLLNAGKLMNPQTGEIQTVEITASAANRVDTPLTEPSKKISISNDELNIKIWYNDAMKWLGLASEVDGNKILYKRVESEDTGYENLF